MSWQRGLVCHTNLPLTCHATCCEIQVNFLTCIATRDLIILCIDKNKLQHGIGLACIKLM